MILLLDKVALGRIGHHVQQGKSHSNPNASFILAIILSVHSVIAGIALGVDGSVAISLVILRAMLSHKGSAAFALSISLVKSGVANKKASNEQPVFNHDTGRRFYWNRFASLSSVGQPGVQFILLSAYHLAQFRGLFSGWVFNTNPLP